MTEKDKLYPDLTQIDGIPDPTHRIKVSKLPQKTTEDGLKYFFENKKMFGGCDVETVDYDPTTNTAVVIFKETDDVERILGKMPILFEDTSINIERHYFEEEAEDVEYNECTIEVTGMSQKTTQQNIQMYFESKKGANADVLVRYKEEDEMYLVKFESETVVDAVLNKRHILDGSDLQVRRHIPFQAESTYPNQVVISGLDIKTTHDSLRNFLEARSKTDINKIMYGEIDGTAIIVFKTQPDIEKLKEECKKRQLDGCYLRVDTVPVSKCIIVSNIKEGTSKDAVLFYFDNKKKSGVEGVSNVDLNTKDRTCIVHFLDTEAPTEACKKGHTIEGHQVKVDIYYECIGSKASEDGPKFRPLDPIDCDLDIRKLQFLVNSKAGKDELEKKLKLCYAKVLQWPENKSSSLKIECLLTADVKNCTKLMKTWETDVNNCLKKILLELRTEELETLQDAWKPVMDIVRSITITDPDLVALSVEKDKCHLCLVGYDKQVRELNKKIKQIISDVNADIEKKKRQLKENVSLKHPQLMILVMCNFPKEMKSTYHELEVKVNIEKDEISFEGLSTNVTSAKVKMYEKLQTMSHIPVERASSCFITFLKTAEVEEFILDQFRRKKKVGIWEIQENDLIMHALSEKEAHACVQIFRSCVIETRIDIDERQFDVLKSYLGKKEVERITNNYSKNLVHISHDTKSTITVLCTNSNEAKAIREDIKNFFLENIYEKVVVNLSSSEIRLLKQDLYKLKLTAIEKEMENDNVKIILNINALIIEGKARNINTAQSKVESIIKTITIKQHVISKPGIMKFMSTELGKTKVKTVEKQLNVIIETAVDIEGPEQEVEERRSYNTFSSSNLMETAQCNVNGGRLIVSVLGDITLVNVDVIVNAANEDLDHRGGLAKVIVDKGGKEIQKECTQHVKQHGKLTEGSVFCSKAGKLNCKMIVHTVGPVWKGGKHDEEDSLKDCVLKSLKETDNRSLTSIAIPAVSTGVYGYPKDKATRVIVKAVQDYLSQNPNSKITKVCLCDVKEDTVSLFVDGMKKYFGKVSLRVRSEDAKLWKSIMDHKGPQSGPGEQKSKTVQFGSISVKVVKGQLAQQKADVIVNSTSRDLRLEGGMLSKSLLMAAGPTLQAECDKQYPKGIKEGEVAKTSGGKLSCKHVFHGCLPSWQYEQSSIKITLAVGRIS